MSLLKTQKSKKLLLGIVSCILLATMLFSAFFVIAEAGHDCTDEDCQTCACIHLCEETLRQIGNGLAIILAVLISALLLYISVSLMAPCAYWQTPVSRKVRMNN